MGTVRKKGFLLAGLDIGGTKIEGAALRGGRILHKIRIPTPRSRREFLRAVFDAIQALSKGEKIAGIGLSVAGAQDMARGVILESPNLIFLNGFPLRDEVKKRFKLPVAMDNDANCFLRAEARYGFAKGCKNVVALTLGTGVGGAVMIGGQIVQGRHGSAGELGHMVIASGGKNRYLNVEDLVSKHGFKRLGADHPLALQRKAEQGDRSAKLIYSKVGEYLGIALGNIVNIFDPEIIVLGGGIAKAGDLLLRPAKEVMKRHALLPARLLPPVQVSKLNLAAVRGVLTLLEKP